MQILDVSTSIPEQTEQNDRATQTSTYTSDLAIILRISTELIIFAVIGVPIFILAILLALPLGTICAFVVSALPGKSKSPRKHPSSTTRKAKGAVKTTKKTKRLRKTTAMSDAEEETAASIRLAKIRTEFEDVVAEKLQDMLKLEEMTAEGP